MFEEKFGMLPKKKVRYDGENVTVNKEVISIEEIKAIYFRPFNLAKNEWGSIYFSTNGNDLSAEVPFHKHLVKFTQGQTEKIEELLELLDMEVIRKGNFADDRKNMTAQNKAQKNKRVCPHCDSANIDFVGNKKKGFSVGKAVGGAVLTGGIGTLAGFAGKKGKKDTWHCKNCGELFEMKTR